MQCIEKYLAIPYRDRGRGFDGVDCWGLVGLVLPELIGAAPDPLLLDYASAESPRGVRHAIAAEAGRWDEVPLGHERLGDVLLLADRLLPSHVGIVLGDRMMLHATATAGVTVESYRTGRWRGAVRGVFRCRTRAIA